MVCGRCYERRVLRKLLKAVQSFYVESMEFVRVKNDVSEWFPVSKLRQGCVMSPRLLDGGIYGRCGSRGECPGA